MAICEYCGKRFEPAFSHPHQKYCGKNCGRKSWVKNNPGKNSELKRSNNKRWAAANRQKRRSIKRKLYYQNKQRALDYKGGCYKCGSKENIVYHHLDRDEKKRDITRMFDCKWETVKAELDKCVPMCDGLHRSIETELVRFIKKVTSHEIR